VKTCVQNILEFELHLHILITILRSIFTSRKHGKKEPRSFVHCGSFDHPDLQSLNDYIFFFFSFRIEILKFWGM
jgi:hypothetical protein